MFEWGMHMCISNGDIYGCGMDHGRMCMNLLQYVVLRCIMRWDRDILIIKYVR